MALLRVLLVFLAISYEVSSSHAAASCRNLPYDVLELCLRNLNIPNLLQAIESDQSLELPAIWAFRRIFAHKVIKINKTLEEGEAFFENRERLYIRDIGMAKNLINRFGDEILKLEINYENMEAPLIAELNELIGQKCRKLQYLEVSFENFELDAVFPESVFPNVETLIFSMMGHLNTTNIDLNERFPKLRTFQLGFATTPISDGLIDRHFPLLDNFSIYYSWNDGLNDNQLERFFQKNPQITSVSSSRESVEFLQLFHNYLPNLQTLQMLDFPEEVNRQGPFHRFDNMKRLHVHLLRFDDLLPFTFNESTLEELKLDAYSFIDPRWIRFIQNHPNIQKLGIHLAARYCPMYAYLADANAFNSKALDIEGIDLNENDEFDRFLNGILKWTKLESVNFVCQPKNATELLRQKFSEEWTITTFENTWYTEQDDILVARVLE